MIKNYVVRGGCYGYYYDFVRAYTSGFEGKRSIGFRIKAYEKSSKMDM